jgi:hypothetical protein
LSTHHDLDVLDPEALEQQHQTLAIVIHVQATEKNSLPATIYIHELK